MKTNDRAEFLRVLASTAGHYKNEMTTDELDLWWTALADWDFDDFKKAANALVRRCTFMPKVSDFEKLRRESVASAGDAWGNALEHADGRWRYHSHPDAFVEEAIRRIGGWSAVALCPLDSLDFKRRDFVEAYDTVIDENARAGLLPLNLPALPEKPKAVAHDPKT